MRVVVVGAGITGLTCALRLSEAGHDVEVLAALPPASTTTTVAAALWYPYRALPHRAVTRWAAAGYAALTALAEDPATGVVLRPGRELFLEPAPDPWWRDAVPSLARADPHDLPPGYVDGYRLTVPVLDPGVHLPWLVDRLGTRGVRVRTARLTRLEDADPAAEVVVDCAGLGARELVGDAELHAVRGQVVVVEQVGLSEWVLAQTDPAALTYVVPRGTSVVCGGTAEVGREDLEPDPATAQQVLDRCRRLVPQLAGARVLGHRVGLRPARPAVRLEPGRLADRRRVVHDYGHGGAGVTLAYGCAQDVVALVAAG